MEAFSEETTHKVKVLLQLPTDDPAFSVFATKFGRDIFLTLEFISTSLTGIYGLRASEKDVTPAAEC